MKILLAVIVLFSGISFADPNSVPQRNLETENKILASKVKTAQKEIETLQAENKKLKALLKFNNIEIKSDRKGSTSGILPKMQIGYRFKLNADQTFIVRSKIDNRTMVCRVELMDSDNENHQLVYISNCYANTIENVTTDSKLPGGIAWQVVGTKIINVARDGVLVNETIYEIREIR
jgi:hypothetical protein